MNDFLNAAAKQLNEIPLTAEGAIVINEAYSLTNTNRPKEAADLFDLIGAALYQQKHRFAACRGCVCRKRGSERKRNLYRLQ